MGTKLTLAHPGIDPFPLTRDHGVWVTALDLGWPETRAVVELIPGQDGTIDSTQFFGGRVATITAQVAGTTGMTRRQVVDRLTEFTRPGLRPVLVIEADGVPARAVDMRIDQLSAPLAGTAVTEIQVSWYVPSGVIRSAESHIVELPRRSPTAAIGRQYPLQYPRQYPSASPAAGVTVTNSGGLPAPWRIRIHGACTNPKIVAPDGASLIEFVGASITAGHYWEADSVQRTVFEDSLPAASRRGYLDYAASTWERVPPGNTAYTFEADTADSSCRAELEFYDSWLT